MNTHENDVLDQELRALADDVPPMPEDFHAGWMKKVEEEAMQKKPSKIRWTRILSVAAALVFVIGGTMLSRDSFSGAPRTSEKTNAYNATSGNISYSMRSSASDTIYYEDAACETIADTNTVMMSKAAGTNAIGGETSTPQKIIRTASLTISTKTFDESLAALKKLCEDMGGYIAYSFESDNSTRRTANLTMSIPSAQLDVFLTGADGTGHITQRSQTADNVTESYYDTAARLETQKALQARLLALVTEAADLSDLLELESKIADIQYQIDRLQGNLNSIDYRVDYATVDVTLREEVDSDSLIIRERTFGERLMGAIKTGWESFASFMGDMVVFLAASAPFIFVIVGMIFVVKLIRKRRNRNKNKTQQ